jgi:two-component system nitrogen regulation response regulator GlnG
MSRAWIADDERSVRFVLAEGLGDAGFETRVFGSGAELLDALADDRPDVVFTDVRMPGIDGLELLRRLRARAPGLPVVVISAYTDVASTSAAFRDGAFDFLSKPFDLDHAVALARRAVAARADIGASPTIVGPDRPGAEEPELLGDSPAMREVFRAIGRVAPTRVHVLVTGETGTGKELVARALHRHSPRAQGPFVALNTAAIPAELLESELFGHEAGAFTGANRRHVGRFEQAAGGTLFLDEIGDMPAALQTRLLRVLAEGEFYRVGGRELIRADVRIVAATHQDLEARVASGDFRADLLHRLDVVRIALPRLAERRTDIPLLAGRFLDRACAELGVEPKRFDAGALAWLADQPWPGNVRQLENACRRVAVMAAGSPVGAAEVRAALGDRQPAVAPESADGETWTGALAAWARRELESGASDLHPRARAELDRVLLAAALEATHGHRQAAAGRLGLGRNTVTRKLGPRRRRSGNG